MDEELERLLKYTLLVVFLLFITPFIKVMLPDINLGFSFVIIIMISCIIISTYFLGNELIKNKRISDKDLRAVYYTFRKLLPERCVNTLLEMDKEIYNYGEELDALIKYVDMFQYLKSNTRYIDVEVRALAIKEFGKTLVESIDSMQVRVDYIQSHKDQIKEEESKSLVVNLQKEFQEDE